MAELSPVIQRLLSQQQSLPFPQQTLRSWILAMRLVHGPEAAASEIPEATKEPKRKRQTTNYIHPFKLCTEV